MNKKMYLAVSFKPSVELWLAVLYQAFQSSDIHCSPAEGPSPLEIIALCGCCMGK